LLGPLSDRFGRRPVLLGGLATFALAGIACALSTNMTMLLVFRLIQGIGAGAGGTLPFAIIRDLFDGMKAKTRMSAVTVVLGAGPIIAPLLGAALLQIGDWRLIFGALGIAGFVLLAIVMLGFEETFRDGKHHALSARGMLASYHGVLTNRRFLGNAMVNAAAFSCMFAYISGSPAVLMGNMGASSGTFSLLFACAAAAFMLGSALNGTLATKLVSSRALVLTGTLCLVIGSVAILVLTFAGALRQATFTALSALSIFGCGFLSPTVAHDALQPMGRQAGVASAALRCMQMLLAAGASALVGFFYDGQTALATASVMTGFALIALLAQQIFLFNLGPRVDLLVSEK
ncbi:MAG: MFS transporter, partial [Proteobacteria bacterium]